MEVWKPSKKLGFENFRKYQMFENFRKYQMLEILGVWKLSGNTRDLETPRKY